MSMSTSRNEKKTTNASGPAIYISIRECVRSHESVMNARDGDGQHAMMNESEARQSKRKEKKERRKPTADMYTGYTTTPTEGKGV